MDTTGETQPQLDALLERDAPCWEFVQLLGSRREAARYLAGAYAARFSGAGQECAVCRGTPAKGSVTYHWNAVFFDGFGFGALDALKLALGHVGVTIKKEVVGFNTTHPLCEACGRRIRNRRWVANVLNFIGLFTVIVAGVFAAICWAGLFYFDLRKASERNEWYTMTAVATGVLIFGFLCLWAMKRMRIPPSLRFLSRRPFFYRSSTIAKRA